MTKYEVPNGYNSYEAYRNYDNRACEVVNEFLDENFYPYITKIVQTNRKNRQTSSRNRLCFC